MATAAQISANRENAQKSTGARTEEGKARSSKNATKHGFNSREFIVGDDQQEEFVSLSESLRQQVSPEGALEEEVFTQLLHAAWNLRRVRRLEADLAADGIDPLADASLDGQLDRLARYQVRFARSFYRAMKELRTLQTNSVIRPSLPDAMEAELPGLASVQEIHRAKRSQKHSFPGLYAGGTDVSGLPPVTPEEAELFAMGLGAAGNQQMGSFSG